MEKKLECPLRIISDDVSEEELALLRAEIDKSYIDPDLVIVSGNHWLLDDKEVKK